MESDEQQWVDRLVAEHGRMVLAAARRVLGNPEDAEDILQDVFLRLVDGRVRRDAARDWGPFLRVMATHAAIDRLRRRAKAAGSGPEALEALASTGSSPADRAEQSRLAALLREALAQLPPREARVFALRHFEELSYGEIARAEGGTANQVGVMLSRARRRLREILEPIWAPSSAPRKD